MGRILRVSTSSEAVATLIVDGQVVATVVDPQHSGAFGQPGDAAQRLPQRAMLACAAQAGLRLRDLDAVVIGDASPARASAFLAPHLDAAPRGLRAFVSAVPAWLRDRLWLRAELERELEALCGRWGRLPALRWEPAVAQGERGDSFGEVQVTTLPPVDASPEAAAPARPRGYLGVSHADAEERAEHRHLRFFALGVAAAVVAVFWWAVPRWRGEPEPLWPLLVAWVLVMLAWIRPRTVTPLRAILRPPLRAFVRAATWLVLGTLYFALLWPASLVMRRGDKPAQSGLGN